MKPKCKMGQCRRVKTMDGRMTNNCTYCGHKLRKFAGRMIKDNR